MRYLNKSNESQILQQGWRYATSHHRPKIREELLKREQKGFCAYTEKYIVQEMDSPEIEHFDERLKNTADDSYWNWYAVIRRANQIKMKKKIADFLPILQPYDTSLPSRVRYENGAFRPVNNNDTEAANLIEFLGWNDPTLANYREKTVRRLKDMHRNFFSGDDAAFLDYIKENPENLSFITVLEAEFGFSFA